MRFLFDKDMEDFVNGIYQAIFDKYVLDEEMPDTVNRREISRGVVRFSPGSSRMASMPTCLIA
jgi:hypothetical protein